MQMSLNTSFMSPNLTLPQPYMPGYMHGTNIGDRNFPIISNLFVFSNVFVHFWLVIMQTKTFDVNVYNFIPDKVS